MKKLSTKTQILFKFLEKTKYGKIKIIFDHDQSYEFGEGELVSELHIKNKNVIDQLLSEGDIALAEAYIKNEIEISNITAFIQWACLNDDKLKATFHGTFVGTLIHRLERWLRPNTKNGAKKNIMAHYDLGNDFYSSWLDSSMSYSSALFLEPDNLLTKQTQNETHTADVQKNLLQAQLNKYDRIIDELNIKSGDRVLEIGCGWGGFFSRAIERTGCHVTAVMNSPAQYQYNQQLIKNKLINTHAQLELKDYREISGTYDKIVSIEMIEAVGEKYWPSYFSKLNSSLKPKGSALIQSITLRDDRFEDYRNSTDFIKKYVFPGGMLLSNFHFKQQSQQQNLKSSQPFEFGLSYAETLKKWRENFNQALQENKLNYLDNKFIRLWNFYLAYCEGAFRAERINVAHFNLVKD